jgi:lipoate-protein ligase A
MNSEETWRLLDLEYENSYLNLALEEAIPTIVGKGLMPNTVRFWRNPNTVVVGYFQSVPLEVNFEACKKYGTAIVRRFTGGGAVYHDHGNLNYAISLHNDHRLVKSDITETFKALSTGVVAGLREIGLNAIHEPTNCFHVRGRKIGGAAGSIKGGFVFYHGSILVNSDLHVLSEVLNSSNESFPSKYVRSVKRDVSTLSYELGRDLPIQEVKEALRKAFEKTFIIEFAEIGLAEEEEMLCQRLFKEKYSIEAWNFKR